MSSVVPDALETRGEKKHPSFLLNIYVYSFKYVYAVCVGR